MLQIQEEGDEDIVPWKEIILDVVGAISWAAKNILETDNFLKCIQIFPFKESHLLLCPRANPKSFHHLAPMG